MLVRCLACTTYAKSIPDRSLANFDCNGTWIASTHTKVFRVTSKARATSFVAHGHRILIRRDRCVKKRLQTRVEAAQKAAVTRIC
jgi:hypothetical protein